MDKGLKILMNTFWGSKGWKDGSISADDFAIAKNEGYMFDYPKYMTHDEILNQAKSIADKIEKQDVTNAFLFSLSTRKLEYRSALASYYYIKSVPVHSDTGHKGYCYVCGCSAFSTNPNEPKNEYDYGLNGFNFERYKWGGVRHGNLAYAKFDVEEFMKLPKVTPTDEDIKIFHAILNSAKNLPPKSKARKYALQIVNEKILKTNKDEIAILLGILGFCDIFNSNDAKGYLHSFTDLADRNPKEHHNDMLFPLHRWCAEDGINADAVYEVFELRIGE